MTTDKKLRKEMPIARGVLGYFPDAIAAVANVSFIGNKQHNGDAPMHWAREKSTDHADCIARHLIEHGTIDDDGLRHSAKLAWRSLALLQLEIEAGNPYSVEDLLSACVATTDSRQSYDTMPLDEIPLIDKGDPRKDNPIGDVPMFNGFPIQYVPFMDGTYLVDYQPLYFANAVYPMMFTEAEPDTDPRTEALNEYLEALDAPNKNCGQGFSDETLRAEAYRTGLMYEALDRLGCLENVRYQIIGGTSFLDSKQYVYIAGPMRGYPEFNFPAFDTARDEFLRNGWNVISPADIDRADGLSEKGNTAGDASSYDQRVFCYRDFYSLYLLAHLGNGAIAMLPGWEKSTGAVAEFFLARWLGLKVLDATTGQPLANFDAAALIASVRNFLISQLVK